MLHNFDQGLNFMCISEKIDRDLDVPDFDIGVFQGSAVSLDHHPLGYAAGERHEVIVFLRQPRGNDTDSLALEKLMRHAGWRKSLLSLLFVLSNPSDAPSDALANALERDETLHDSYRNALEHGAAVIVCGATL